MEELVHKDRGVSKAHVDPLDLMVGKEIRELSANQVTLAILDPLDSLELRDSWVGLERRDCKAAPDSRVSKANRVRLESKDPLGLRDRGDHLEELVKLDCRDLQDFQVLKDRKEMQVCDLM